jgi:hypothetical protein
MDDAHRITAVSVSTIATTPLRGSIEIDTPDSTIKFELNEDIAHSICSQLEHFLTQGPRGLTGRSAANNSSATRPDGADHHVRSRCS